MEEGVRLVLPQAQTVLAPVADGGDGTLEVLVGAPARQDGGPGPGRYFQALVTGPLGEPVMATWGVMADGKTAVIEMARASGLALVPPERRDPRRATSYGTGELLRAALDAGYRDVIVGLGGSATNDAGAGLAHALGARLTDGQGEDIGRGGAALALLEHIDLRGLDPRLKACRIRAAADVNNPLCGPKGASAVYGPQKGATPQVVQELDAALRRFAHVVRTDLGVEVLALPMAGAAGGAGAGLVMFLGATLEPGGELVCDAVGLDTYLEGAAVVLTGEGRLDSQTAYDKAPMVVARRAHRKGVPVIAVAGTLGPGYRRVLGQGVVAVEVATPASMTAQEGMARAHEFVRAATERAVRAALAR